VASGTKKRRFNQIMSALHTVMSDVANPDITDEAEATRTMLYKAVYGPDWQEGDESGGEEEGGEGGGGEEDAMICAAAHTALRSRVIQHTVLYVLHHFVTSRYFVADRESHARAKALYAELQQQENQ
jgi:hypothetical protein